MLRSCFGDFFYYSSEVIGIKESLSVSESYIWGEKLHVFHKDSMKDLLKRKDGQQWLTKYHLKHLVRAKIWLQKEPSGTSDSLNSESALTVGNVNRAQLVQLG